MANQTDHSTACSENVSVLNVITADKDTLSTDVNEATGSNKSMLCRSSLGWLLSVSYVPGH